MLEHKEKEADYWGRFANSYDDRLERMFGKDLRPNLARILENERGLGYTVEFGCGTGYFTRAIAKNAVHVTATDISGSMIGVAKARLKGLDNVSFSIENSESSSFPSETFDTALMANMLHTLDDPLKALKECHRVLKSGGTLLIINYTDQGMSRFEKIIMSFRFTIKFGFLPRKNWPMTEEKLRSLLSAAGFDIERLSLITDKINTFYIRAKNK